MSISETAPKQHLFAHFASVARALGHAHRLDLLEALAQSERNVEALAARAGQSIANTSQHLQQLRRAGLVDTRRQGKHVIYRLKDDAVLALIAALQQVAERNLAEVQLIVAAYFSARDNLDPVSRQDLLRRLAEGDVIVLDVRPEDEFAAGHLPGAINVPASALDRELALLPRDKEIVAYCRGPYCVLSFDAIETLRARGFRARRLEGGFPDWKVAGLTVATG